MKILYWPIPVVGVFVAALATAQEPPAKPSPPQAMQHGMMRDGTPMPMQDMGAMMAMMQSMTPEQRAKMMEHCRQMTEATPSDSNKTEK